MMQSNRLGSHRELRTAELIGSMVADQHVLDPQQRLHREFATQTLLSLGQLFVHHLDPLHQVADQLSLVGVAEDGVVLEFADLADVMQEHTRQEQPRVDLGIQICDSDDGLQQVDNMLQQPPG